jgi:two-component system, OmpR family, heavy metal sensor histidine kinase CusS
VKRLSIRWRLTLWYGGILWAILTAFSAAAYMRMRQHLLDLTDATLREELVELEVEIGRARELASSPEDLKIQFSGPEHYVFQVIAMEGGRIIFRSAEIEVEGLPSPDFRRIRTDGVSHQSTSLDKLGPIRTASRVIPGPSGPLLIQAAASMVPNARALRELVMILLSMGPLVLACGLGCGYWLARKALAPVNRMMASAAEITATRLDRRVDEPETADELSCLARTFNAMIARLQRSFEEVRRFTADAAHELRTPLATMRTEAEVALRSPRSPERDARVLEDLLEEIERLTRLVSQLLFLCREDTGIGVNEFRPMKLDDVVRDVVEHMQVMAREKGVKVLLELSETYRVNGDKDRLRQLFFNLLDNAIKYTPSEGTVTVRGESFDGQVHITVTDTGIGIPAEHVSHVFNRFYRVDPSRSLEIEGTGLGLAICQSIAEAHEGRIAIKSDLGGGTRVTLVLPMAQEAVGGERLLI